MKISDIEKESGRIAALKGDEAQKAVERLKEQIALSLNKCKRLQKFEDGGNNDECYIESTGEAFINIEHCRLYSSRFASEIVFRLRDREMACYVRLIEFKDSKGTGSQNYGVYEDFDDKVSADTVEELAAAAVKEAKDQRARLRSYC